MELNIQQIKEIIPHRFPFLMIDKVLELEPNDKLVALKNVSVNEPYFVGHFPDEKVMPGVMIIEAMAQAGCIYFYYSKNLHGKFNSYKLQLKMGSHMNRELQKDYTHLGEDKFSFEVVDKLEPKEDTNYDYTEDLAVLEEMWIEKLQPYDEKGYNKRKVK